MGTRIAQSLSPAISNRSGSFQSVPYVSPIGSFSPDFGLQPVRQIGDPVSRSLLDILCLEGSRLFKFLHQEGDPRLRCLSSGFGFR